MRYSSRKKNVIVHHDNKVCIWKTIFLIFTHTDEESGGVKCMYFLL